MLISPLLSAVYLHYVLDRWRQAARGEITIVRYAGDAILGFERQDEAKRYLGQLKEHLRELSRPATLASILAMLTGCGVKDSWPSLGIQTVYTTERISVGKFFSFTRASAMMNPAESVQRRADAL